MRNQGPEQARGGGWWLIPLALSGACFLFSALMAAVGWMGRRSDLSVFDFVRLVLFGFLISFILGAVGTIGWVVAKRNESRHDIRGNGPDLSDRRTDWPKMTPKNS